MKKKRGGRRREWEEEEEKGDELSLDLVAGFAAVRTNSCAEA